MYSMMENHLLREISSVGLYVDHYQNVQMLNGNQVGSNKYISPTSEMPATSQI